MQGNIQKQTKWKMQTENEGQEQPSKNILEMLKLAFNQCPKPSKLMRDKLAKDTGLTMRVIQVRLLVIL